MASATSDDNHLDAGGGSRQPAPPHGPGQDRGVRTWLAAAFAACFLLIAGCATHARHEWLVLFFDGVPPEPGAVTNAPAAQAGTVAVKTNLLIAPPEPKVFVHGPYADRECTACHESKFSQRMRGKLKEVCLGCHSDLLDKAKSTHSPVEDGECLQCHNPHQAPRKFLLVKKPTELCVECHDDTAKAKYPHAPVSEGECLECHKPHASDQPHLLARKGGALCYTCHDQGDVKGVSAHAGMGDAACTGCHDPHGSDRKFMLKAGKGVPSGAPAPTTP